MSKYSPEDIPLSHDLWRAIEDTLNPGFSNVLEAKLETREGFIADKGYSPFARVLVTVRVLSDSDVIVREKMFRPPYSIDLIEFLCHEFNIPVIGLKSLKIEMKHGDLPIFDAVFTPCSKTFSKTSPKANQLTLDCMRLVK